MATDPTMDEPDDQGGIAPPAQLTIESAPKLDPDAMPDHCRRDAAAWWQITEDNPSYKAAIAQYRRDRKTLRGGTEDRTEEETRADDRSVQHFTVYRNAQQSVSFLLATPPETQWMTRRQAKGLQPTGPVDADPQLAAFTDTLDVCLEALKHEAGFNGVRETMCWRGVSFQAAYLRVTWQEQFVTDPITGQRQPDSQDNAERVRYLLEALEAGAFTEDSAEYHELVTLSEMMGQGEIAQWKGLVYEALFLDQVIIAPNANSPERLYAADWIAIDHFLKVSEILTKFPQVDRDDLRGGRIYTMDGGGFAPISTETSMVNGNDRRDLQQRQVEHHTLKDDSILRVREIQDRIGQKVVVICEGLPVAITEYARDRGPNQFFDIVGWVTNWDEGSFYGRSYASLQDKVAARIDRKSSDEEMARYRSHPRWGVDGAMQNIDAVIDEINNAGPYESFKLPVARDKISEAVYPFYTNGSFNPAAFDRTADFQLSEQLASIPRQALGTTGQAKFAAEVDAAAAGQNASASRLKRTWAEALARADSMAAELLVENADPELVQLLAGPQAFWPDVGKRRELLRALMPKVVITYSGAQDKQNQAQDLAGLVDLLGTAKQAGLPADALARLWAKVTRHEWNLDDLIKPDPMQALATVANTMQTNPQALTPQALQGLAAMGLEAHQLVQQMLQAMPPGGGPGGPPRPGGQPAPGQPAPQPTPPGVP